MILVDTSVWIDHLHRADATLTGALERDDVVTHDLVIEELALGSIASRSTVLENLGRLARTPVVSHQEVLDFVDGSQLWGRGLSVIDAHLLASTLLTAGARLWTRDRRLATAAAERGVAFEPV